MAVMTLDKPADEKRRQRVIAVKALYRAGEIEFLEPVPALAQMPVIVVFLDPESVEIGLAPMIEHVDTLDWGEPMDAEGAQMLVALHEELAPYRIATTQAGEPDTEA